jgi:hypothetical protein
MVLAGNPDFFENSFISISISSIPPWRKHFTPSSNWKVKGKEGNKSLILGY